MTSRREIPLGSPGHRAAAVALVVVVAAILTAVVRTRPRESSAPPARVAIRVAAEPVTEPEMAQALIDAIPWGRLERIETLRGGLGYRLPDPRETPVLLELPVGEWRVVLSNPSSPDERVCELDLVAGAQDDCRVEFERLSVDEYFREAGWWR